MTMNRGRERGAIAVWTAVGLLGFLLATGIGVDFSGHARATQEARAVAAEAARAGGQRITLTGGRAAPAQQAAASAAERFAARSGFHATATVRGTSISVTVRGSYETSFLGVIGIWDLDVHASSTANVESVLDGP